MTRVIDTLQTRNNINEEMENSIESGWEIVLVSLTDTLENDIP